MARRNWWGSAWSRKPVKITRALLRPRHVLMVGNEWVSNNAWAVRIDQLERAQQQLFCSRDVGAMEAAFKLGSKWGKRLVVKLEGADLDSRMRRLLGVHDVMKHVIGMQRSRWLWSSTAEKPQLYVVLYACRNVEQGEVKVNDCAFLKMVYWRALGLGGEHDTHEMLFRGDGPGSPIFNRARSIVFMPANELGIIDAARVSPVLGIVNNMELQPSRFNHEGRLFPPKRQINLEPES